MFFTRQHGQQLRRIETKLDVVHLEIRLMALDLSKLTAAASAAEATITDLRARLAAALAAAENPADQAAVDQIATELTTAASS